MTTAFTLYNSLSNTAASQSEMVAETSTTTFVTPSNIKYHPGATKAWARFQNSGTASMPRSVGMSSITDNGTGDQTLNFSTAFANTNYVVGGSCNLNASGTYRGYMINAPYQSKLTTSCRVATLTNAGVLSDSLSYSHVQFIGTF